MPNKRTPILAILFFWIVGAVYFAAQRSFWGDELIRLYQAKLGLKDALQSLFSEASPFAPGEVVLNFISRKLFSYFLPDEVWARLPGVFWMALGFVVITRLKESQLYKSVLAILFFFSVAVWSLGIEMRPYSALIFSGVFSYFILEAKKQDLQKYFFASLLIVAFSHLYGICFLGFAFFLRKRWIEFIFAAFLVILVLSFSYKQGAWQNQSQFLFVDIARQTLGVLGNPSKGTYVLLPFFVYGLYSKFCTNRQSFRLHLALLAVTLIAPIVATFASGYYFVPRQCSAAVFPFLATSGLGVLGFLQHFRVRTIQRFVLAVLILFSSVLPWSFAVIGNRSPFPDQPRHVFARLVREDSQAAKAIFIADPCSAFSFLHYAELAWGKPTDTASRIEKGIKIQKNCFSNGKCVSFVLNSDYCSDSTAKFSKGGEAFQLLSGCPSKLDLLVYSSQFFPVSTCKTVRSW